MRQTALISLNEELPARVEALRRREAKMAGSIAALESELISAQQSIASLSADVDIADRAKAVLETYAIEQQNDLQTSLEDLCTRGLRAVFHRDLEFKVTFKVMRGQPEVSFSVVSYVDGEPIEMDIANSFGGGLAVVCGVLLRVVVLKYLVEQGRVAPVLILDEPLAALSPSYPSDDEDSLRSRMALFLRAVCDELGVQIVLITHEPDYGEHADQYYTFRGGLGSKTVVRRESGVDA